jgi:hypothetical protein
MNARRIVLLVTCLVVAGLLAWLAAEKWTEASKIATIVSALGAVAAVGVAVWAALPSTGSAGSARAARTGKAMARGKSTATSGVVAGAHWSGNQVIADRTGDADASDGGDATSGVKLNDASDTQFGRPEGSGR